MKKTMINYIQKDKFDEIYTPEYAIKPLLKYLPKNIVIWECTDFGGSNITKVLKNNGFKVVNTNKAEIDFLQDNVDFHFDMIITNPPYSLKDKFIEKCYEYGKPFCLLLPITSFEGKKRGLMFRKYGIEALILDGRVQFMENMIENYNKKKSSNWFNTSWFCWKVLPQQLIFEELDKGSDSK